jgi:hypothetical protein
MHHRAVLIYVDEKYTNFYEDAPPALADVMEGLPITISKLTIAADELQKLAEEGQ